MKKLILLYALIISFGSFGQNQIISEENISEIAKNISESTSGRKISNNDITIMRAYSVGRTIVCYYNVPEGMELEEDNVKRQRISQMKASGFGEVLFKDKINFHMWFHKNDIMYLKVILNYQDFK